MPLSHARQRWILISLLLVFGAVFLMRGPVRAINGGADLAHLYAASVLWLDGGNPYDGAQCVQAMQQASYPAPDRVGVGSYYPPPTIATLAPIGLLGWDVARLAWVIVNLGACFVLVWCLEKWLVVDDTGTRWMLAALMVIAWGPVMTTFSVGQLSLVAGAAVCCGVVQIQRGRSVLAGLSFGIACLVKPQMGLGFLVLLLVLRDWRAMIFSVAIVAGLTAIGVGRLMVTAPDWVQLFVENIQASQADHSMNDASVNAPLRHHLIDMRPVLHLLIPGGFVDLFALASVAFMAALAVWKLLKLDINKHLLLASAGVGLLILLPVYHRYYDAVLLMPLLALVVNRLWLIRSDVLVWVIVLAMVPLVFPAPAALRSLSDQSTFPQWLAENWIWQNVVLLQHAWCLLIAAIALVWWTLKQPKQVESADGST